MDHDGRVGFEEFRSYVEKRRMDMERAFDKLDADTEGRHLGGINSQTLVPPPYPPSPILFPYPSKLRLQLQDLQQDSSAVLLLRYTV